MGTSFWHLRLKKQMSDDEAAGDKAVPIVKLRYALRRTSRAGTSACKRGISAVQVLSLLLMGGCGNFDVVLQDRVGREAGVLEPTVSDDAAVVEVANAAIEGKLPPPEGFSVPPKSGLEDYISLALKNNPKIHRKIRKIQVLGYRVPQVTSLDDPLVTILPPTGSLAETAAGVVKGSGGIFQTIPWFGKLNTKGEIAEQEVQMAFDDLGEARIATVVETIKAYDRYYLADVSIRINKKSEELLGTIRDVASTRYRAGDATQQDVLRAEVELYSLTNDLITLNQEKAAAAALLNSLMYRRVDAPLPGPAPFKLAEVKWALPEVMKRAVKNNPKLARLQQQVNRDLKQIDLAHLDYYPNLKLGFSYSPVSSSGLSPVADGGDIIGAPFGFNLPIYRKRLRAQVLERNSRALTSVEEFNELRNAIFFQLQDTLLKIDTQYRQAVLLRDALVPRSWQAVEVSTSEYRAGNLEFTALIENWRIWLNQSLLYHKALTDLEQRFADLQHLVGLRLSRSPDAPPKP